MPIKLQKQLREKVNRVSSSSPKTLHSWGSFPTIIPFAHWVGSLAPNSVGHVLPRQKGKALRISFSEALRMPPILLPDEVASEHAGDAYVIKTWRRQTCGLKEVKKSKESRRSTFPPTP